MSNAFYLQKDKKTKKPIGIEFRFADARDFEIIKSKDVGRTRFTPSQIASIGDMLIRNFGNYHRLFWNCQHFAECLMDLICGGEFESFDCTSSEMLQKVMFATIILSGTAATRKIQEKALQKVVVEKTMNDLEINEEPKSEQESDDVIERLINHLENDRRNDSENSDSCNII